MEYLAKRPRMHLFYNRLLLLATTTLLCPKYYNYWRKKLRVTKLNDGLTITDRQTKTEYLCFCTLGIMTHKKCESSQLLDGLDYNASLVYGRQVEIKVSKLSFITFRSCRLYLRGEESSIEIKWDL